MEKQEDIATAEAADGRITISTHSVYNEEDDGGSSGDTWTMTQGEIVFATLACFVVVSVSIYAMYATYQREKRRKDEFEDEFGDIIDHSMVSSIENMRFMKGGENAQVFCSQAIVEAENATFSSPLRDNRRRSVDSASTLGSKSCVLRKQYDEESTLRCDGIRCDK